MDEPDSEAIVPESTTVWDFPVRGAWATHRPDYRGNFAPQIPRNVILTFSEEGDLVLDPMVGSGTTLIEARLLGRNAVGYDINSPAVEITRSRIRFGVDNDSHQRVEVGDVRSMPDLADESVDLIVTHPPYLDLVKYSDGENPKDLSSISRIPAYLDEMERAAAELFRVLKAGRYCSILMGDTRRGQHFLPLSHFVLRRFLRQGFVLKEDVIKTQHNTKYGRKWAPGARALKFYLIMHEHLFIFRRPEVGESLSRVRYSAWKAFEELG